MPQILGPFESFLQSLNRSKPIIFLFRLFLRHFPRLIPVRRVFLSRTVLAFFHPKPVYPFHVLILPRNGCKDLFHINIQDSSYLSDCYLLVPHLVKHYSLSQFGYQLILNGGFYQKFPLLHIHLISDSNPERPKI